MKRIAALLLAIALLPCWLLVEHGLIAVPQDFDRQLLMQMDMSRLRDGLRFERAVRQVVLRIKVVDHQRGRRSLLNDLRMRETTGDPVFAHQTVFSIHAYDWTFITGTPTENPIHLFGPRGADGASFRFRDLFTNQDLNLTFIEETQLRGLPAYKYRGEADLDAADRRPFASSRLQVELWIEPLSGYLLDYQAQLTRAATDSAPLPLEEERISLLPSTAERLAKDARFLRHQVAVATVVGPLVVVIFIALLLTFSLRVNALVPAATATAGVIGVLALIGWLFGLPVLSRLHASLNPMPAATALQCVLAAVAVAAYYYRRTKLSRYVGFALLLVSGGVALTKGLAWLARVPPELTQTDVFNPEGLVGTLCFLPIALSLVLPLRSHNLRRIAALLLTALAFWVGLAALASYFVSLRGGYEFEPLVGMAPLTAVAVILLALCSMRVTRQNRTEEINRLELPAILFVVVSALSLVLANALRNEEQAQVRTDLELALLDINGLVSERLNNNAAAIGRMAQRMGAGGSGVREAWVADARTFLRDLLGLHSVHHFDPSGRLVASEPPLEANTDFYLASNLQGYVSRMLVSMPPTRGMRASKNLKLNQTRDGLSIVFPMFVNDEVSGYQLGVIDVYALYERSAFDLGLQSDMQLTVDERYLISAPTDVRLLERGYEARSTLSWDSLTWELRAQPTRSFVLSRITAVPLTLIVVGLVFASGFAVLAWLMTTRRDQALKIQQELVVRTRTQDQLNALVAHSPNGIILVDKEGIMKMVNHTAEQIFDYDSRDLVGRPVDMLIPQPYRHQHHHMMRGFFAEKKPRTMGEGTQVHGQRRNGETFPIRVGLIPMNLGGEAHVLASIIDISALQQAEKRLLRSQEALMNLVEDVREQKKEAEQVNQFLEMLLDNIPDTVFVKDAKDLRFLRVNRAIEKITGMPRDAIIGKTDFELWPDAAATRFVSDDRKVLREKIMLDLPRERFKHRTLGDRVLHTKKLPILDRDGNALYLLGITTDITRQLHERQQVELQGRMLALSNDAILVWNRAEGIVFWNQGAEKLYGYSQKEATGRSVAEILQADYPEPWSMIEEILLREGKWQGRIRHRKSDGSVVTVESVHQEVTDQEGRHFILEVNRDITETLEYERSLEIKTVELERSNRELEQFAYLASHDLQEPLRKLVSFSEYLQADLGEDLPERARTDLFFIMDSARRMRMLVQDLLELSRAGTGEFIVTELNINEVVDDALDALSAAIEESNAEIIREDLPNTWGDRRLITQLYQNLVGNAIKFVPAKQKPVIHLTVEYREDKLIYGVKDNGIGIDAEHQEKIFQPFKRLHARDQYSGSGIGLSICKRSVERHGGQLWVESNVGAGAHFRFTLSARKP